MKIVGLITEYNPFHAGHLYHMQQARERPAQTTASSDERQLRPRSGNPPSLISTVVQKPLFSPVPTWYLRCRSLFLPLRHEFTAYGVALLSAIGVDAVCVRR